MHATKPKMAKKWEKEKKDEAADRDYKDEYKKFQSSDKSKKYRAELNQYNRKKGTYGNGDGKDASHKGGKIAGFEAESKNRGRAEKSRLKKESPDFNPMIDAILDEVIDEYQTTNEKVLKKNPGEFVDAKFSKAIDKLPNSKLTKDLVIKLAKKYKVDQDDALRFVSYGYLRDFGLKESVNETVYQFKKYTNTQMDKLDALLSRAGYKGKPDFNKMTWTTKDKNSKIEKIIKSKGGKKIKESVNEKMDPEQYHKYMQYVFDTQFKTPEEKKMKKSIVKKINVGQKKKGLPVFKESVTEVQKRQATDVAVKFDKAYLNFSREIRDIIKMVVRITGNRTDGKIFDNAYKKQLIPFDALFKSWYKGQQDNPHIKESDLGLTYKKGKTVKVKHKTSGKRLVVVDKPAVRKEYEKIGYFAESVDEATSSSDIKKAIAIAKKMSGNMTGAVKKIDKIKKGLSKDKQVAKALQTANESVNEINGVDLAKKVLKDKQHE